MSRRDSSPPDSSNLLLDTLCNTFGSLIFIAMMLVAMNTQVVYEEADSSQKARDELTERQISRADTRLSELSAHIGTPQQGGLTQDSEALSRIRLLEDTLHNLQAKEAKNQDKIDHSATALINLGNLDYSKQGEKIKQEQTELSLAESQKNAAIENLARLEGRIIELNQALKDAKKPKVTQSRLPKENANTGKQHLYVFVRFGKIYPMYLFQNGIRQINKSTINWVERGESTSPRMQSSSGWKIEPSVSHEWDDYLRSLPKAKYYIAFLTWPDSFTTFNMAKSSASALGWDVGWEPFDNEIVFGSDGSGPPPPL